MKLIFRIEEGVLITLEKRLMGVHAASILSENRFRHEGGIDTMPQGDFLNNESVGHRIVRHGEGIGIAEVDFMLAGSDFMMTVFHMNSHGFQG